MSDQAQAQPKKRGGWLKTALIGVAGLGGGAVGTYATAVIDKVAKPTKPVANFAVAADGLTVTCQNRASGESGWWDFGDGTALEPFDPAQPEQKHTYAKPGNYTVKLTVRNFMADENERTVPVEVAAAAAGPATVPAVLDFAVRPVSAAAVAPATFRITGEVKDAQACVWDFGDGRTEVAGGAGKVDRMVTFERPGDFTVQLIAHNGRQAVKLASPVSVKAPADGSLSLTLRVTDTGSRVEQVARSESVAVPVPKEFKGSFSRTVTANPGCTIAQASSATPTVPGVKNLKVAVAGDGRSAVVTGDWDAGAKGQNRAAGGSDAIIPLKVVEKRTSAIRPVVNTVGGATQGYSVHAAVPGGGLPPIPGTGPSGVQPAGYVPPAAPRSMSSFELPLPTPPAGLTQHTRQIQVELRQPGRKEPLLSVPNVSLPWSAVFATADGRKWVCSITPDGAKAVVSINPLGQ